MASKYKAIDFFCGGGGMTCGLRQEGCHKQVWTLIKMPKKRMNKGNLQVFSFKTQYKNNFTNNYFERKFGIRKILLFDFDVVPANFTV